MDTVASQIQGEPPGVRQVPGGAGRLNANEGGRNDAQTGAKSSRSALRHARDVLADLMQRDSKD